MKTDADKGMKFALTQLREMLQNRFYMEETPIEVQRVMETATTVLEEALGESQKIAQKRPNSFAERVVRPAPSS